MQHLRLATREADFFEGDAAECVVCLVRLRTLIVTTTEGSLERLSCDVGRLSSLVELRTLHLSSCSSSEDATTPTTGESSGCFTSDVSLLSTLVALESLCLSGCRRVTGDVSGLSTLVALTRLDLAGCERVTGDASHLSSLVLLQRLEMGSCDLVELRDVSRLSTLARLNVMGVCGCEKITGELTADAVRWLSGVKGANLNGCGALTVAADLSAIANITRVKLSGTTLRGDVGSFSTLVNLESLRLGGSLAGNISQLSTLVNLETLKLSFCTRLTGDVSALSTLVKLEILDLSYAKRLQGDVSKLSTLVSLKHLNLEGCAWLNARGAYVRFGASLASNLSYLNLNSS